MVTEFMSDVVAGGAVDLETVVLVSCLLEVFSDLVAEGLAVGSGIGMLSDVNANVLPAVINA